MIRLTYINVIDCSADVARGTHRPDLHAEHARCELLICSSHDSRDDALPDIIGGLLVAVTMGLNHSGGRS